VSEFIDCNITDIISMEMDIYKAKILNHIKIKKDKGKQALKARWNITVLGKQYSMGFFKPYIIELINENAIIDNGKNIDITEKGIELLNSNIHLTKRYKVAHKKTHSNKGIPTPRDIQITNYLKKRVASNTICTFTINDAVKDLGVTKQMISYRIKRLKDAGYLDYVPRNYNTIKILKEIE